MAAPLPLPIPRPCTRCWRPLTHCACEASSLLTADPAALAQLERLRAQAQAGAWRGELDTVNEAQRRWAFLLWRLDRDYGHMRTQR